MLSAASMYDKHGWSLIWGEGVKINYKCLNTKCSGKYVNVKRYETRTWHLSGKDFF